MPPTDTAAAVLKDIAYFYQVMSDYGHIMGDLDYSDEFGGDYWRWIDVDQPEEIRRGALAILVAQISEFVDGAGNTVTRSLDQYSRAVSAIYPQSESEDRLIEVARIGLRVVQGDTASTRKFEDELPWVYEYCVDTYFSSRSTRKTTKAEQDVADQRPARRESNAS